MLLLAVTIFKFSFFCFFLDLSLDIPPHAIVKQVTNGKSKEEEPPSIQLLGKLPFLLLEL